jgi:peptidoglycan/LPS O-acetylase OafA/YrhL
LNQTIPYWSLAVEEQFYLLWPLVVWFCPDRRTLLRVTAALIGISCVLRFAAPMSHLSPTRCYFFTPTRIDGILLGVLLALIRHESIYKRLSRFAKYAALGGLAAMLIMAPRSGWLLPNTYYRIAFEVPFANLTAAAIILAVMEEGSLFCRICSRRWICWLGSRSYGLYVIHFLFRDWFCGPFALRLAQYMPLPLAFAVSTTLAFCLTLALAVLSYRFVEQPAMNLKKRIRYGAVRKPRVSLEAVEPALAQSDS